MRDLGYAVPERYPHQDQPYSIIPTISGKATQHGQFSPVLSGAFVFDIPFGIPPFGRNMYAETVLAIIVVISIALCGVLAWMCHSGEERSGSSHISSNLFYLPMDNGSQGHNNLSFMQDSSTVCVVSIPTTLSIQPAKIHCTPRPIFVQD